MKGKFLLDAVLEHLTLFERQAVGLGDDRHDIDRLAQLPQDDNVNGLEGVAGGGDEVETAVDACVLDVAFALGGQLLAQVGAVLILYVLDNGVPAAVVVDQVAVAGGVDNVQAQTNAILLDDVSDGMDLGGLADGFVGFETTFGVDQVRGEDGVDEGAFAESGLAWSCQHLFPDVKEDIERRTDANDVELKPALEQLLLNLRRDAVETDVVFGEDRLRLLGVHSGRHVAVVRIGVIGVLCGGCELATRRTKTVCWKKRDGNGRGYGGEEVGKAKGNVPGERRDGRDSDRDGPSTRNQAVKSQGVNRARRSVLANAVGMREQTTYQTRPTTDDKPYTRTTTTIDLQHGCPRGTLLFSPRRLPASRPLPTPLPPNTSPWPPLRPPPGVPHAHTASPRHAPRHPSRPRPTLGRPTARRA